MVKTTKALYFEKKKEVLWLEFFYENFQQMMKLVNAGASTEEIMAEVNSLDFVRSYWMMIYKNPEDPFEKKEAITELRKRMLI
jgi:hypothetical protein